MAKNYWRGDAFPVAMRRRFTVGGTPAAGNTVSLVVNGKSVTYTVVTGDTGTSIAAGLAAAWAAAGAAGLGEGGDADAEYADGDLYLDLVATEAGRPFTVTAAATGGGATLTASTIADSSGPSHYDLAANWTLGIPDNTQDVIIDGGAALLYGGGSIDGLTIQVRDGFQNAIGLPRWSEDGYYEYRTRELTLNAANVLIRGGGQMFLKAVAFSTWRVEATGNRDEENTPAVDIGATGNPTLILISGASDVGLLTQDESAARTFATVRQNNEDSRLTLGRLATVTTLDKDTGTLESWATVGTLTNGQGEATLYDGALTTLVAYGGLVRLNLTGTIASVTAVTTGPNEPPVIDCEGDNRARTFTASMFSGGAALYDTNRTVTTGGGSHTADALFFLNSRLGPLVNWSR